jgi:hypothetical protein
MLHVIEIGGEVQINDARLLFDDRSGYTGYGFMRRPLRSIRERLQNEGVRSTRTGQAV